VSGTNYVLPVAGFGYASAAASDFRVPTDASSPNYLTVGPDGAIWFTLFDTDRIGRVPLAGGAITEFRVTPFSSPADIATGRDGNLWFTLQDTGKIGRMTPTGTLTEFDIPTASSLPRSIIAAPDGMLYFTQIAGGKIGRVSMSGAITEFMPNWAGVVPRGLDVDAAGNLWFADSGTGSIARMTPAGVFTRFVAPWPNGGMRNVKVARDGSVWFTEPAADRVGRFDPATSTFREFRLARSGGQPFGITQSEDGNMWFTSIAGNRAGRITAEGNVSELRLPSGTGAPVGIIAAPDGALWYAASSSNRVGRINPRASTDSLNLQDLWWSTGESGHGLSIQQKGTNLFITWYLYDANGRPNWVVVPTGRWNSDLTEWTGDAYTPRGTWFARYDARQLQVGQPVGQVRLRQNGNDAFTLNYTLNNVSGTKQFARFAFAQTGQTAPGAYGDMWYGGANNSGWGLAVNQQGGTLFLAWYTYDQTGTATWFVVPSGTWSGRSYTGRVFKTAGAPVLGVPFNANALRATDVGSMELLFTPDGRNASVFYTVEGQTGFDSLGRLAF
jgi:virginiamycin B lyase